MKNIKINGNSLSSMLLEAFDKGIKTGKEETVQRICERFYNQYTDEFEKNNMTIRQLISYALDLLNQYGGHFAGHYGVKKLASTVTEEFKFFNY